jgi:hypothetical protein
MARTAVLAALIAALALPGTALASGQLATTEMTPAQSANIVATTSLTFRVRSSCQGQLMQVLVGRDSTLDADGLLVAGAQVDRFTLSETTPGVYEGATTATWLQTPGTYFWQAEAPNAKCDLGTPDGGPALIYTSGVVGITILPGSSGGGGDTNVDVTDNSEILTIAQAKASLPDVLRKGTRRTPRRVSGLCTRHGSGSLLVVFCTTRWTDGKTWSYNGAVRQALNADGTISARFDGRRAKLSCLKKAARKIDEQACYRKFHFTAVV